MVVFNAIAYPHLNPTMPIGGGFSLRPGTDMTLGRSSACILFETLDKPTDTEIMGMCIFINAYW